MIQYFRGENIDILTEMALVGQVMKLEGLEVYSGNISQAELDKLRSLLPENWKNGGGNSQIEVILEAIDYIKILQGKLQ